MKKITILILTFLCLWSLVMLSGCNGGPLVAEFNEDIEDAVCFYKEEFDLEPYIKKQDGVKYTVTAEQIDSETFETLVLDVDGFKFTPLLNEEVLVSFIAEKNGEKVMSKEIKIFLEIKIDPIVELFNGSWKDDGMSKEANIDERYIRSGRRTSTLVNWFGKEANNKDRFQNFASLLGNEITDYYSVTDWTDAVLTFWVYNPTDYEIEFAPIWSHNQAKIVFYSVPSTIKVAAPNEWTEIKYSLRYYGMTENFYYDDEVYLSYAGIPVSYGIGFDETVSKERMNQNWWTCRWGGREEAGKSYSYSFYVDGFDIRDYDAQKDADLDHEYRGYWNEPLASGDGLSITVADNDVNTLSFEYKMLADEGSFGVALIDDDWVTNYFGYFMFDKDGEVDDYAGVTVTTQDNGYMRVDFALEEVDLLIAGSTKRPKKVQMLYVSPVYNNANFIIRLAE